MAKIALKLVHFKEQKKIFCIFKTLYLSAIFATVYHDLSKQNKKQKYLHLSKFSLENEKYHSEKNVFRAKAVR